MLTQNGRGIDRRSGQAKPPEGVPGTRHAFQPIHTARDGLLHQGFGLANQVFTSIFIRVDFIPVGLLDAEVAEQIQSTFQFANGRGQCVRNHSGASNPAVRFGLLAPTFPCIKELFRSRRHLPDGLDGTDSRALTTIFEFKGVKKRTTPAAVMQHANQMTNRTFGQTGAELFAGHILNRVGFIQNDMFVGGQETCPPGPKRQVAKKQGVVADQELP